MSDIFLSYAREDRETAQRLAVALERHGWTVWWDRRIPAGRDYADVIKEALDGTRCVIVLWSKHSTVPRSWVRKEAGYAETRGILVPALTGEVEIPFEFERIQAADLVGWEGQVGHAGFSTLVNDLRAVLAPPEPEGAGGETVAHAGHAAPTVTPGRTPEPIDLDNARRVSVARRAPTDPLPPGPSVGPPVRSGPGPHARRGPPGNVPHTKFWRPPIIIASAGAAVVLLIAGYMISAWMRADNRGGQGNVNARQTENRTTPPDQNGQADAGRGNLNRGRDAGIPESKDEKLTRLVQQMDDPSEATWKPARDALIKEHPRDPRAVAQALDLLVERRSSLGKLSTQGFVNALYFLSLSDNVAWTEESLQKAEKVVALLDAEAPPGAEDSDILRHLRARIRTLRSTRNPRPGK